MYQVWADNKTGLACWFFFLCLLSVCQPGQDALTLKVFSLITKVSKHACLGPCISAGVLSRDGYNLSCTIYIYIPVCHMQYEDQCKCLRHERAFQNLSRAAFSFQTLNVPLPSQPSFHLRGCNVALVWHCTCSLESFNGRIVPNCWCCCWQANCEG